MVGYQNNLTQQAQLVKKEYEKFNKVLASVGCSTKEDFVNDLLVLDSASMFIQYITNISLGNEISHYLTPSKYNIGNIRNDLSHLAINKNNEMLYDVAKHYLNNSANIEYLSNEKIKEYPFLNNKIFSNRIDQETEFDFIKNSIANGHQDFHMISKASVNLTRINRYMKGYKCADRESFLKDEIIFNAVCYNLMTGLDCIKLSARVSKNDLYTEYPNLRNTRNKIAHELHTVSKEEVYDAIKDYKKLLKAEYNKKKNEHENNKGKII